MFAGINKALSKAPGQTAMWPAPRQQVPWPASFYLKRMQLFISASLTSLGEVAAVHILSLEDMLRVRLQVYVFVCVEELHVHHLSFPDKIPTPEP